MSHLTQPAQRLVGSFVIALAMSVGLVTFTSGAATAADSSSRSVVGKSDAGKIKQILYNLLSNAVKFTPPKGRIVLSAAGEKGSNVRLTVSDNGPGIPESQRAHIFEKFYQADSSATREHTGTGLGLAITRDLVGILGGTITLEPDAGIGATFIVSLPLVALQDAPTPARRRA